MMLVFMWRSRKVVNRLMGQSLAITALLLAVAGCGESKEQQAFRAELVDKALNDENSQRSQAFLKKNKQRQGVVTTKTGLQYLIVKSGSGDHPSIQDKVRVHYEGKLINGELFDSSYQRGDSSVFPLKEVITGWRQALLKMKVGDHWQIYLPSKLAYGARSPSEQIAANSALVFDIKLLEIIGSQSE